MADSLSSAEAAALQFAIEAGPRAFDPDLPTNVRLEIAKSTGLSYYKEAAKKIAEEQWLRIKHAVFMTGLENRLIEKDAHATRSHIPHCRIPLEMHQAFEAIWGQGCWKNDDFLEDTLKHHPELRINVKYGTKGQEYAGRNKA
jgi:hypothetical protein